LHDFHELQKPTDWQERCLRSQPGLARYTKGPAPAHAEGFTLSTCQSRRYPWSRVAQQAKHSGAENFLHFFRSWAGLVRGGVFDDPMAEGPVVEKGKKHRAEGRVEAAPTAPKPAIWQSCGGPPAPWSQCQTAETSTRTATKPSGLLVGFQPLSPLAKRSAPLKTLMRNRTGSAPKVSVLETTRFAFVGRQSADWKAQLRQFGTAIPTSPPSGRSTGGTGT
jgi:hypothetical protein